MKLFKKLAAAAALITAFGAAQATVVQPGGGGEPSLQSIINSLYTNAGTSTALAPDVNLNQYANDQFWAIEGSGASVATMVIELSAGSSTSTFGVYDVVNGNKAQLFGGSAGTPDQAILSISSTGQVTVIYMDRDALGNSTFGGFWQSGSGFFTSGTFGYYLGVNANTTWYSEQSKNGGSDQMVAYQGDGDKIQIPGNQPGVWGSSSYILAWEDVAYAQSDKDFQDFVVYVESVTGVPEPGTLALVGLSLAGVAAVARRRRQQA